MKRGDRVYVCYDGKWGRRVVGEVLATKQTSRVQVKFQEYASDRQLTHWFRRRSRPKRYGGRPHYYGGFVPVEDSLMRMAYGLPGDWYSVFKLPRKETP